MLSSTLLHEPTNVDECYLFKLKFSVTLLVFVRHDLHVLYFLVSMCVSIRS